MKNLKMNLFAIIALVIAGVTMSFKMADKSSDIVANQYWFEMNAAGTTPLPGPLEDVDEVCPSKATTPNCARLYNESQTTGSGSSRTVISSQINNQVDHRTRQ